VLSILCKREGARLGEIEASILRQREARDGVGMVFPRCFPGFHPGAVHAWRQGEMTYKEPSAARELMSEGGDPRQRDVRSVGMGGEGGGVCDAEGFEVVVGEEVEGEAEHGSGDIAREAGCFTVVVGEVFADFSVDIV